MRTLLVIAIAAACGDNQLPDCASWRQWGNDAAHEGETCTSGQPLTRALGGFQYDPFIPQEVADSTGDLIVHYQSPLIDGDRIFMMTKTGTYTPCERSNELPDCFEPDERNRLDSQVWAETSLELTPAGLAQLWSFNSDWKPFPEFGFEPMFQPALVGDRIAIPGASGSVWELDSASGAVAAHITPFADDPDVYVAGAIAEHEGAIYYNAIRTDPADPYERAWLVAIDASGVTRKLDYTSLIPDAPGPDTACFQTYDFAPTPVPRPWPPLQADGTPVLPPQAPCGYQVPGLNSAPAFGEDGTIFAVTHASNNSSYSYIVALTSDLALKWATSLRGMLADGCGVLVADDGGFTLGNPDCRPGAPLGVDPATGMMPAAAVDDDSSSSPVALPGGGVLYGALTLYNGFRGHLIALDESGKLTGTYDFGWDTTPAVVRTGNDYRIVVKDNHYGADANGDDAGPYYITELDSALHVVWQLQSTNTQSCARGADGTIACTADHPHGFEWCINAPAVDQDGTIYGNSEDGNLYAITSDGQFRDHMFLDQAIGAAYTPIALDHRGRIYALNHGTLSIVGAD